MDRAAATDTQRGGRARLSAASSPWSAWSVQASVVVTSSTSSSAIPTTFPSANSTR